MDLETFLDNTTKVNDMADAAAARWRQTLVLQEVRAERDRQEAKFGEQNPPNFDTSAAYLEGHLSEESLAGFYKVPPEALAKMMCQTAFAQGRGTWMHILVEEVAECVGAYDDATKLRAELVQVAAVTVAWIEALDRKAKA